MTGYIAVETELYIQPVPEHLLDWETILWPPERNALPRTRPGSPLPLLDVQELYHRHVVVDAGCAVRLWTRRDPESLPHHVKAAIRERALADARSR